MYINRSSLNGSIINIRKLQLELVRTARVAISNADTPWRDDDTTWFSLKHFFQHEFHLLSMMEKKH